MNAASGKEPDSHWRKGFEFVEAFAKMALAFAVIGYISLRAHLNSFGIPFRESAPPERYLMEMWGWLVATLFPLVKPVCSYGLVAWAIAAVSPGLLRRIPRGREHWGELRAWWTSGWNEVILLIILAVTCIATALMVEEYCRVPAVIVGPLAPIDTPTQGMKDGYLVLVILWILEALFWIGRRAREANTPARRLVALAMLSILTLQLPMLYGWLVREARCPAVTLVYKAGETTKKTDGLLIFDTAERFIIWRAARGEGQFVSYRREQVVSVTEGRSFNLREVVAQAIAQPDLEWPAALASLPIPPKP